MFRSQNCGIVIALLTICSVASLALAEDPTTASLKAANGFLSRSLFDLAEAEYRRVLKTKPDDARKQQAEYGLSVALMRQQKREAAKLLLQGLLSIDDFEFAADVVVMLAQCHLADQEYDTAAQLIADHQARFIDHALADDAAAIGIEALYRGGHFKSCANNATAFMERYVQSPSAGLVCAYAGMSQAAIGQDTAAIKSLQTALKFDVPVSHIDHVRLTLAEALARQEDANAARSLFNTVGQSGGPLAARSALGLGLLEWRAGDYTAALTHVNKALQQPAAIDVAFATQLRGRIQFARNAFDDALKDFESLTNNEAARTDNHAYWLAKTLAKLDQHDRAAKVLSRAIDEYSKSKLLGELRFDLAVALVKQDQFEAAYPALTELIDAHAREDFMPDALRMAAIVAHRLTLYEASDDWIRRWREESTNTESSLPPDLLFVYAENAYLMQAFAQATERYLAFLSEHPTTDQAATARRRLGLALYHQQQLQPALAQFEKLGAAAHTPASIFAVGDIHFASRNWQGASQWLNKFVASNPTTGIDDGLIKLGLAHLRLGEFETALQRFNALLERDADSPHAAQALFERGQCFLALDRMDEAARSFERVLQRDDASRLQRAALEHLAALGLRLGKPELAAQHFSELANKSTDAAQRAKSILQQSDALLQAGNYALAAGTIEKLFSNKKTNAAHIAATDRARLQANLVIAHARANHCQQSVDAMEQLDVEALDLSHRLAALYDFAFCLQKLGDEKRAVNVYQQIADVDADHALKYHALLALAGDASRLQRHEQTITFVDRLLAAKSNNKTPTDLQLDRAVYLKGQAQVDLKQYEAALVTLRSLRADHPSSKFINPATYLAGEAAFAVTQWEAAAQHFETALKAAPEAEFAPTAQLRLADSLAKLQRWAESEKQFAEYIAGHANSEFAYQARFGLAWTLENQGRFDDALTHYRSVTNNHQGPTAARAQFQIGQCLFAQKHYESAVGELLKTDILYAYPEWSAAALYEAGRCLEQLRRFGAAREQFRTVIRRFEESKWAGPAQERLTALANRNVPGE